MLAAVCTFRADMVNAATTTNIATNLLLQQTPLIGMPSSTLPSKNDRRRLTLESLSLLGAIVNAGLVFLTFLISLPGATMSTNRSLLKLHSWLVIACALLTLVLGLAIWFSTLKTRSNLSVLWSRQTPDMQSLLQQRVRCPLSYLRSRTNESRSSTAVAISTVHLHRSSRIVSARARRLLHRN